MTRESDRYLDPPDDEPECTCRALNDDRPGHEEWCQLAEPDIDPDIDPAPVEDKDAQYWENLK